MARTVVQFIDTCEFGGAERSLLQLITGLDRQLWRPVLLLHPAAGLKPLVEAIATAGLEVRYVPRLQGGPSVLPRLRQAYDAVTGIRGFMRELRLIGPDVFHAHQNWPLACKYALLAAGVLGIRKIVTTVHLCPPLRRLWWLRRQHRLMLGKVDTHIAVSNAVAADLHRQLNITKHKITVVPNSVGFDEPVPVAYPVERHLLLAPGTTNLALTLARLSDEKGLPYLIRAAVQCPNVTFLIAGVGPQLEQLEADARALGVDARVRFLGYRTDVQHLLSISDMFILPSLCEGLPLSVLEAMAAGKPVIASSLPAIEEAVVHGCTGLLVPPRDPSALARAITELASDSCLAYTLGFAASADVKARFSRQSMISSVSSVYLS